MNKKLYVDGLRQLKIPGIIGTVLMSVIAFFVAYANTFLQGPELKGGTSRIVYFDFATFLPMFIISGLVFAIIMTMVIFSFLHRRNSSDFFHALPLKREQLYFSFVAAIASWILAILVIPAFIICLMFLLDTYHYLDALRVVYTLGTAIVCALLVVGASLVGVSATGTGFTNFVVLSIILIVPRMILLAVVSVITENVVTVGFGDVPGFFGVRCNALFASGYVYLLGFLEDGKASLPSVGSLVYTFVLSIVYGAWGLLIFKKRKSEVAGMPNFNRFWQGVTRTVPAFCLTAIGTLILASFFLAGTFPDSDLWFWVSFVYAVAIVVYFLYELITTKKWSALKGAAKTLPILILANVLLYMSAAFPTMGFRNDYLNVDQVTEVMVRNCGSSGYYSTSNGVANRAWKELGYMDDKDVVETLVNANNNTLTVYYHNTTGEQPWNTVLDDGYTATTPCEVTFKVGGRTERRTVYLSAEQEKFLQQKQLDYTKSGKITLPLPMYNKNSSYVYIVDDVIWFKSIFDEDLTKIYEVWRQEVGDYATYLTLPQENTVGTIVLRDHDGDFSGTISNKTPKSLQALIDAVVSVENDAGWTSLHTEIPNGEFLDLEVTCYRDETFRKTYSFAPNLSNAIESYKQKINELHASFGNYDHQYDTDDYVVSIHFEYSTTDSYVSGQKTLCMNAKAYEEFAQQFLFTDDMATR